MKLHMEAQTPEKFKDVSGADLQASGNRRQVMCRVDQSSRELGQFWTENLLLQHFVVHSRKERDRDTNVLHSLKDRKKSQKKKKLRTES